MNAAVIKLKYANMLLLSFFLFTVTLGNHSLAVASIVFKNLTTTFMSDF